MKKRNYIKDKAPRGLSHKLALTYGALLIATAFLPNSALATAVADPTVATAEGEITGSQATTQGATCTGASCTQAVIIRNVPTEDLDKLLVQLTGESRPATSRPVTPPQSTAGQRDTNPRDADELSKLMCEDVLSEHERAVCLAENLSEMEDMMKDNRYRDLSLKQKIRRFYERAERLIKRQLVKSMDVLSSDDFESGLDAFDEIADVVESSNSRLKKQIPQMRTRLIRLANNRTLMEREAGAFENAYNARIERASENLRMAKLSGNEFNVALAQDEYDALMKVGRDQLQSLRTKYDPAPQIDLFSSAFSVERSSVEYFETQFKEAYENIQASLNMNGFNNLDQDINQQVERQMAYNAAARNARNPGFSIDSSYLQRYYNNRMITGDSNRASRIFDDNSVLNNGSGSASQFLSDNQGRFRPRTFGS